MTYELISPVFCAMLEDVKTEACQADSMYNHGGKHETH